MRFMRMIKLLLLISVAFLAVGCGSGGGASKPPQQKSATVTFGIFANSTTHVLAVDVSAKLPAGVEVALDPGTVDLRQPDLTTTQGTVFGKYSTSSRKVNLHFLGESSSAGNRPFATLTLAVLPGFNLTQADFTALNNPFPGFLAVGRVPGAATTITTDDVLAGKITPTMSVSFGF